MAPKSKTRTDSSHRHLVQGDLEAFRTNLVKTREMTTVIETAFQKLHTQIRNLRTAGSVMTAVDQIVREIRKCQETVDKAMLCAQAQEDISASLIREGRYGDALASINEGLAAMGELTRPFFALRDRLNNIGTNGPQVVAAGLKAQGFDKEIEAWDASVNEWAARTTVSTWKLSEVLA